MGPRATLDNLEKRNVLASARNWNPNLLSYVSSFARYIQLNHTSLMNKYRYIIKLFSEFLIRIFL